MDKIIQQSVPIIGVVLGQVATQNFPIGPRYHAIHYIFTATSTNGAIPSLTDVAGLIKLLINGKTQREHLAAEIDGIQAAYGPGFAYNVYNTGTLAAPTISFKTAGQYTVDIHLCLNLSEPWRKAYASVEYLAWPTAWANGTTLQSFQSSIAIPNTGNVTGLSAISWVEQDAMLGSLDANKNPVTLITKMYRNTVPYAGAGVLNINTLARKDVCLQISAFTQPGDPVSWVQVKTDNVIKRDMSAAQLLQTLINREWNESAVLAAALQAGATLPLPRFDVAYDYTDFPLDGLNLANVSDYQFILTIANGGAASKIITLIDQRYGNID